MTSETRTGPGPSRRSLLGAAAGLAALPAVPALAEERRTWRLVTSWPKGAPGPGTTAARLAEAITRLSAGRLTVELYGAGELVPAFEVFDAVAGGTVEMGHSAAFFWAGKMPASPFFTAVPFGLLPESHNAWIAFGGGQALYDELYGGFGVKPFLAGNSGFQMGGWYKREIASLDDLAGLKVRMPGLGGEVLRRLGATPVSLPPGEIFAALKSGLIDGAEFLGPWSDRSLGLNTAARFYYWPGFHEPNGSAECLVNRAAWEALPDDLRQLVELACAAENQRGLSEAEWNNAVALGELKADPEVELRRFPDEVLAAARRAADEVLDDLAAGDPLSARIRDSFAAARSRAVGWGQVSRYALLGAQLAEL